MGITEIKGKGPFATAGILLNTVSTVAIVTDDTIRTGGAVISNTLQGINLVTTKAVEALEITLEGPIEDLRCDALVDSAHRKVRLAQATAEADRILLQLKGEA